MPASEPYPEVDPLCPEVLLSAENKVATVEKLNGTHFPDFNGVKMMGGTSHTKKVF